MSNHISFTITIIKPVSKTKSEILDQDSKVKLNPVNEELNPKIIDQENISEREIEKGEIIEVLLNTSENLLDGDDTKSKENYGIEDSQTDDIEIINMEDVINDSVDKDIIGSGDLTTVQEFKFQDIIDEDDIDGSLTNDIANDTTNDIKNDNSIDDNSIDDKDKYKTIIFNIVDYINESDIDSCSKGDDMRNIDDMDNKNLKDKNNNENNNNKSEDKNNTIENNGKNASANCSGKDVSVNCSGKDVLANYNGKGLLNDCKELYFLVPCPHCQELIQIYKKELNCKIFRHGVFKTNGQNINPHMSEVNCKNLIEKNLIYGCAGPFKIRFIDIEMTQIIAEKCPYI